MGIAKRLAESERRERLTWEEAVAHCLRRDHHDDVPPTREELEPHQREGRPAGAAAASIAFLRQRRPRPAATTATTQGTLF
jgi:hypothetical protein